MIEECDGVEDTIVTYCILQDVKVTTEICVWDIIIMDHFLLELRKVVGSNCGRWRFQQIRHSAVSLAGYIDPVPEGTVREKVGR